MPPGVGSTGDDGQELAVRREFLHAVVVKVGDEDLVGLVDGNADRKVKLAGFRAFAPPFRQESRRTGLRLSDLSRLRQTRALRCQKQNARALRDYGQQEQTYALHDPTKQLKRCGECHRDDQ